MNKQEAIEVIKNIDILNINDMIAGQNVDMVIKNQVIDIISQIDEPQKVVVPQVAVDYYERYKDQSTGFDEWFGDFYDGGFLADFPQGEKLAEWLYDNDDDTNRQRELALATLIVNGPGAVEVEREKLYTVEIPDPNCLDVVTFLCKENGKVFIGGDIFWDELPNYNWKKEPENQLTESEIKKDFDWAWQFREEVEVKND